MTPRRTQLRIFFWFNFFFFLYSFLRLRSSRVLYNEYQITYFCLCKIDERTCREQMLKENIVS